MKKSYLNDSNQVLNYYDKNTYFNMNDRDDESLILDYDILPEEYNVFSSINFNILSQSDTKQKELLEKIFQCIRSSLKLIYYEYGILKILPKLDLSIDDDGALILNWAYAMYRIYFDIEKDIDNSFYGLIIKDSENSIQTKTELITKENCAEITGQIIQYIFNQT